MTSRSPAVLALAAAGAVLLASCGGGGSLGDVRPGSPPIAVVSGPDSFLLFPNPQKQPDGTLQTDTEAYARAYYAAIDPTNAKDTLAKWKAANGFDSGSGTQAKVVFGDKRDLGYGRLMTARQNADGTLAFMVENYLVEARGGLRLLAPQPRRRRRARHPAPHRRERDRVQPGSGSMSPGRAGRSAFTSAAAAS